MKRKAVFLDRDGVLNEAIVRDGKPYSPVCLEEVIITADVLPALRILKSINYLLIGATNQPDVARNLITRSTVERIHDKLLRELPIDAIHVCYHDEQHACTCRKPQPGLLINAAQEFNLDLSQCFMIGDRWKDIEAGQKAGCKTIWLNRHYHEKKPEVNPDYITTSLLDAAIWIQKN